MGTVVREIDPFPTLVVVMPPTQPQRPPTLDAVLAPRLASGRLPIISNPLDCASAAVDLLQAIDGA